MIKILNIIINILFLISWVCIPIGAFIAFSLMFADLPIRGGVSIEPDLYPNYYLKILIGWCMMIFGFVFCYLIDKYIFKTEYEK